MAHPAGEAETGDLRVDFDRRLRLEFHGSRITSDAGLLAFRELDDALGLTGMAGDALADSRTGRNSRHSLMAQFRQSVFGRLAGYEDVNDADRLGVDPAMRWIVGGQAVMGQAASTSQMGRFETEVLAKEANVTALADLSGRWIDVYRLNFSDHRLPMIGLFIGCFIVSALCWRFVEQPFRGYVASKDRFAALKVSVKAAAVVALLAGGAVPSNALVNPPTAESKRLEAFMANYKAGAEMRNGTCFLTGAFNDIKYYRTDIFPITKQCVLRVAQQLRLMAIPPFLITIISAVWRQMMWFGAGFNWAFCGRLTVGNGLIHPLFGGCRLTREPKRP